MLKDLQHIRQKIAIQALADDAKGKKLPSKSHPSKWLPGTAWIENKAKTLL